MAAKIITLVAALALASRAYASPTANYGDVTDDDNLVAQLFAAQVMTPEPTSDKLPSFELPEWDMRRSNHSSGNGTSPGGAGGGAPTPPPSTKITQTITFAGITASQYVGTFKQAAEQGYGVYLGIYNATAGLYIFGASVDSSTSRRAISVQFEAVVPHAQASAATAQATALSSDSSQLSTLMTHITTQATAVGASVPSGFNVTGAAAPTTTTVAFVAPTPTPTPPATSPTPSGGTTSDASQNAVLSAAALVALALALKH